jgi:uncharacterized membrane protein
MTATPGTGGLLAFLALGSVTPAQARVLTVLAGVAAFFFPFSLLFIAGGLLPAGLGWIGSVMILLYGALLFASETRIVPVPVALGRAALLGGTLFLLEYVGVTTGMPFGRYVYEDTLGFRLLGVPVAIAVAWYATVLAGWRLSRRMLGPAGGPAGHALLTAFLTLAMDAVLEPFAWRITGYWTWLGDAVPVQNYVSWGVISAAAAALLSATEPPPSDRERHLLPVCALVVGLQMILFTVTVLLRGYWVEPLAAAGLLAAAFLAARVLRKREAPAA